VYRGDLRRFEVSLAGFVGVKHAVGVSSGYDALHLSLVAAGIGPGDEVVTVAHTFVATISAIVNCGATPVLVDVGPDHNMDPDRVARALTGRTKALLPVHLNGRVCDMEPLLALAERHGLTVIEDAAQALGATYRGRKAGSFGRAGCFSFYPFKLLGGFGDGGAVTTDDPDLARAVRLMRYNGEDRETGEYHYHGRTALLDNVQAAVLEVKLGHLSSWIAHRQAVAARYRRGLEGIGDLRLPHFQDPRRVDVYQNYVVRTGDREPLRATLRESGIETLVHWPKPVWEHKGLGLSDPALPETERLCREVISLPMSAETTDEHVDLTVGAIRGYFG
jgi:dTDP-4-amino-4,6-dideoxygalactose transaminase